MDNVVALEVAEQEFERFLESMDLQFDLKAMDDDDRKGFEVNKARFLKAVQRGSLVVNERGEPVYRPTAGDAITFREPTGATLMAIDSVKKGHDVAKSFAVLAEMTRTPRDVFAKMVQRDLNVCQAVLILFLASR